MRKIFNLENLSLTQKLMLSYVTLIVCVLILTMLFILPVQLQDRRYDLENDLIDTASILSTDPSIINGLKNGIFEASIIQRLDYITRNFSNKDYLVIADSNNIRLYHPDHSLIGKKFVGGDEISILSGAEPYITEMEGSTEKQLRAFHHICNEEGNVIGFVMISDSMRSIQKLQRQTFMHVILVSMFVLIISLVLSYAVSANIKRILLGNDPPTFARMFLQREEILNHLSEGILAFDESRNIVYKNNAGSAFYPDDSIRETQPLYAEHQDCMKTSEAKTGIMIEINGRSYIMSVIPVIRKGLFHIVMIILHDRTEIVHLTEQITGTNHVVDALRANTHEFLNKLHVISGLLQTGETEKAIDFIGSTSNEIESCYHTIIRQIQNRAVAALILGKMSHAKELNIQFSLRQDSLLPLNNHFLTTQEIITIIGNLVENSFDAINGKNDERSAELFIYCDDNGITISVDDTGCGMNDMQIQSIYSGQYTTKGFNHGYGMRLIQDIVRIHNGFLQIDSEQGSGSSVSVIFGNTLSESER